MTVDVTLSAQPDSPPGLRLCRYRCVGNRAAASADTRWTGPHIPTRRCRRGAAVGAATPLAFVAAQATTVAPCGLCGFMGPGQVGSRQENLRPRGFTPPRGSVGMNLGILATRWGSGVINLFAPPGPGR